MCSCYAHPVGLVAVLNDTWKQLNGPSKRKVRGMNRLDLNRPGIRAHAAMLSDGRTLLRRSTEPVRLLVGHRALLPVASLLAREVNVCSMSVLCYGQEVWTSGLQPRRLLKSAG